MNTSRSGEDGESHGDKNLGRDGLRNDDTAIIAAAADDNRFAGVNY